jgi:prevent-host-death family protein
MTMVWRLTMKTMKASEFKARCLSIMDEVAEAGEPVLITKNGRPVAELWPLSTQQPQSPFGLHKGMGIEIKGDIVSPLDADWEALH